MRLLEGETMKLIDLDKVLSELGLNYNDYVYIDKNYIAERIRSLPVVETKQIKYFDEEEKVWKIGSVIVNE